MGSGRRLRDNSATGEQKLGTIRLLLALSVLSSHAGRSVFGLAWLDPHYAVNAFFIISGFYMAMVLNTGYLDRGGVKRFYATRIARLYPIYLVGILVAIVTYQYIAGTFFRGDFSSLTWLGKVSFLITNVTIVGQDLSYLLCYPSQVAICGKYHQQMLPPAWAISIELIFYSFAPFVVRSFARTYWFTLVGVLYLIFVATLPPTVSMPPPFRPDIPKEIIGHVALPASFMFFGLGALAYHASVPGKAKPWMLAPAILLVALSSQTYSMMPWLHALVFAGIVPLVFRLSSSSAVDRWLGDLSYPVYILHFPVFRLWYYDGLRGSELGTATALTTLLVCVPLVWMIERPVERLRHRLFPRMLPGKPASSQDQSGD